MKGVHSISCGTEAVIEPKTHGFFRDVLSRYRDDPEKLKLFAALVLHEVGDFTTREIGDVFGKDFSTISRNLKKTRTLLRQEFQIDERNTIEKQSRT